MTINKVQGANLNTVKLNDPLFSHSQFYVALSQVASQSDIFVATNSPIEEVIKKADPSSAYCCLL